MGLTDPTLSDASSAAECQAAEALHPLDACSHPPVDGLIEFGSPSETSGGGRPEATTPERYDRRVHLASVRSGRTGRPMNISGKYDGRTHPKTLLIRSMLGLKI